MKKTFLLSFSFLMLSFLCLSERIFSQNVGIGTTSPNAKAALEIKSIDKGVLFPRLTTAQRNTITNPPDGLHLYNTDEHCLNYYDSAYQVWNCYCAECRTIVITISSNMCKVNFFTTYAILYPSKKYIINIMPGVIVSGCNPGDTALSFNGLPYSADITINNYGIIEGAGGNGGNAAINRGCKPQDQFAFVGQNGGYAISTKDGIPITIKNYGIVAGGGGGGGGSGGINSSNGSGGFGGGGAGIVGGIGGIRGGFFTSSPIVGCVGAIAYAGQDGAMGQSTVGGAGGVGANGGSTGGNGGARAQPGQNGTGYLAALGGVQGKAIGGGTDNTIIIIGGGQTFGFVD